jgi:hypothetical protein
VSGNRFWEGLGKVSAVLGAFGVLVGIYATFRSDGPNLHAECSLTKVTGYSLLADASDDLSAIRKAQSLESIRDVLDAYFKESAKKEVPIDTYNIASRIENMLKAAWPQELIEYTWRGNSQLYNTYLDCSVVNDGKKTAEDVKLITKTKGNATITQVDSKARVVPFDDVIEIGGLRPRVPVSLTAWINGSAEQWNSKITYKDGDGTIAFSEPVFDIFDMYSHFKTTYPVSYFVTFIFFLSPVVFLIVRRVFRFFLPKRSETKDAS